MSVMQVRPDSSSLVATRSVCPGKGSVSRFVGPCKGTVSHSVGPDKGTVSRSVGPDSHINAVNGSVSQEIKYILRIWGDRLGGKDVSDLILYFYDVPLL